MRSVSCLSRLRRDVGVDDELFNFRVDRRNQPGVGRRSVRVVGRNADFQRRLVPLQNDVVRDFDASPNSIARVWSFLSVRE